MKKKGRYKSSSKEKEKKINGQSRSTLECLGEYSNGSSPAVAVLRYTDVLILLFPIQLVDQAWKLKDKIGQPFCLPSTKRPTTPPPLLPKPKQCSCHCCLPHGKLLNLMPCMGISAFSGVTVVIEVFLCPKCRKKSVLHI